MQFYEWSLKYGKYEKQNWTNFIFYKCSIMVYMIFSNLTHVIFEIDEYFTFALIKFPLNDIITITSNDVRPPLYYLILKFVVKTFDLLNLQYNLLHILKILSIVHYINFINICYKN